MKKLDKMALIHREKKRYKAPTYITFAKKLLIKLILPKYGLLSILILTKWTYTYGNY